MKKGEEGGERIKTLIYKGDLQWWQTHERKGRSQLRVHLRSSVDAF